MLHLSSHGFYRCWRLCFGGILGVLAVFCGLSARGQESVYQGAFGGGTGSLFNAMNFEATSGKGLSIINFFKNWDDTTGSLSFPTSTVDGMRNHGSIPMVTWQPGGANPDATYQLTNIINGNFDPFIQQWALDAKAWGYPFFLRFAHEMNGTWYPWCANANGNTAADYVAAWRHVHDIFVRNGVTNVTWVWCVSTIYSTGSGAIAAVYPGDNYVDWISLDSYNRVANPWSDFGGHSQNTLDTMVAVAPGKPIMVAEAGCHEDPVNDKGQWFRNALANYLKYSYPRIKAWTYFNGVNPDGNDWRIDTSAGALAGYQSSIGLSYYSDNSYGSITASPIQPLTNDATSTDTMPPFVSIVTPAISGVQAGVTTEWDVLASDKSGIAKVDFYVNGVLSHTEKIAPYQYFWPVPSGSGTAYTILAKAYDTVGNTATSTVQVVSKNPPAAPAQVAASDGTYTDKVRVTWNSVSTALSYEVWRATGNDSTTATKLNPSLITTTTYDDTTAAYTTPYYYWVRAVDDTGPSAFGVSDSGYRALPPLPTAPTGVYATDGAYDDSTLVGWSSVSGANGYEVWRNTTNNTATATKLTATAITGTSYYDTTGVYALKYYYWVKAVNDGGTSAFSTVGAGYRGNLPTISALTDRTINQNTTTGAITLTVGDVETAAANLTLSAGSSNTALVPLTNIVFGGGNASRTVTVTPATGQAGTATITVTVTDADGGQASAAFVLTVNAPPTISALADTTINKNTSTGAIVFTVGDAETAAASLVVTASSSNTTLVPAANIVLGGSGANRTITVTPAANQSGTATITLTVSDGMASVSTSFVLTVNGVIQASWTAMTTTAVLPWSTGANWSGGVAPPSGLSTLTYLSGSTLPTGSINSNNDLAAPFALTTLTLSGTGPANGTGAVNITGGPLHFVTGSDGTAPAINLAAVVGTGSAALSYNLGLPMVLDVATGFQGDGTAAFAVTGNITGAGGIVKSGGSTLALSGTDTYTGATTISAGTLQIGNGGTAGSLAASSAVSGATGATLALNRSDGLNFANAIGGALAVKQIGGGNTTLGGSNSYTGTTTIGAGTLTVSANTALGTTAGATVIPSSGGQLAFAGGISVAEPITINGRSSGDQLINSSGNNFLTGAVTFQTGGNGYFLRADADKLTINGSLTMTGSAASKILTVSGAGNLEVSGAIGNDAGTLGVTKTGTGTLTLSGPDTYNGATTVSAGTLAVGGNLTATSGVTVAPGATLTGGGTIGAVTVINGTHAPGTGVGTQTFSGALTYGATSHLAWALAANTATGAGTNFDFVNAGGVTISSGAVVDVVLNSPGSTVNFTNAFWQQNHAWTAVSATALGGMFTLGTVSADASGHAPAAYGLFSLQQTGMAFHVLWTPLTPTQAWQYRYFGANWNNAAIAGDNADPDGDGMCNLLEYALGKSPVAADGTGIQVVAGKGNFVMTYPLLRNATDITVQPEWSTDMLSWSNQNVTQQVIADDGTIQTMQATVSYGANVKLFMRLRVTRP